MTNEAQDINFNIDGDLRKQLEEAHVSDEEPKPEEEDVIQKAEDEIKKQEDEQPEEEAQEPDDEGEDGPDEHEAADEEDDDSDASSLRRRIEQNYREKLKERDDEMAQMREELKQLQMQQAEQKGYMEASKQQEAVDQDPEPDPVLDPDEHNAWKVRQLEKENSELKSTQDQQGMQLQMQQARQAVTTLEREYKRMNTDVDYDAIKDFVKERNATLLKIQHPSASDLEISAAIEQAEIQIFADAYKGGHNGAAAIVKMADELGYTPKKDDPKPKPKPDLKKIKENQKKNASLIGGTDSKVDRSKEVTPEKILNMSMGQLMSGGDALFKQAYRHLENSS